MIERVNKWLIHIQIWVLPVILYTFEGANKLIFNVNFYFYVFCFSSDGVAKVWIWQEEYRQTVHHSFFCTASVPDIQSY